MMEEFCKKCGIEIQKGLLLGIGGQKSYRFEDGTYCEKCAKAKVETARKS